MKRKYDKRILSDFLADLGEKLGRIPRPRDLEKGMPSRSTYARYFDSWKTALEYAGYVEDISLDRVDLGLLGFDNEPRVKVVNFLGKRVMLVGPDGQSVMLKPEGLAKIIWKTARIPAFADKLAPVVAGVRILASKPRMIVVEDKDGKQEMFPDFQDGVYYLVPQNVAKEMYRFWRTSNDLLYPKYGEFSREENCDTIVGVCVVWTRDLGVKEE